jgi:hypothetical protein
MRYLESTGLELCHKNIAFPYPLQSADGSHELEQALEACVPLPRWHAVKRNPLQFCHIEHENARCFVCVDNKLPHEHAVVWAFLG